MQWAMLGFQLLYNLKGKAFALKLVCQKKNEYDLDLWPLWPNFKIVS